MTIPGYASQILIIDSDPAQSIRRLDSGTLETQIQLAVALMKDFHVKGVNRVIAKETYLYKMWSPHLRELKDCIFWLWSEFLRRRGYKHITHDNYDRSHRWLKSGRYSGPCPWFKHEQLIASHRAYLLRENYIYYSRYGWDVDTNTPEWWPENL
jgi:hypothetical protein